MLLSLSLCFWSIGSIRANPMLLTLEGEGAGADVTVSFTDTSPSQHSFSNLTGFAGQMLLRLNNGPEFIGFCVDLAHFISNGQTFKVRAESTDLLTNGAKVAYLANTYGPYLTSLYSDPNERNIHGAALQIAIWSELYDNGTGFTSGNFQYTAAANAGDPNYSAIAAAATEYLSEANNHSSQSTWYDGSPSGDGQWRGQNMVLADPPAAPEPSSFALFGMGSACLALVRWRKQGLTASRTHAGI